MEYLKEFDGNKTGTEPFDVDFTCCKVCNNGVSLATYLHIEE